MGIEAFINKQVPERQEQLAQIHQLILENDPQVTANIEPMMGKEMIVYKGKGMMKYGLSSVKNYMSLHALPIYGWPPLHKQYSELLPKASFQKGCINFKTAAEMPLDIVRDLIADCAKIDLQKIREDYLASKKKKKK